MNPDKTDNLLIDDEKFDKLLVEITNLNNKSFIESCENDKEYISIPYLHLILSSSDSRILIAVDCLWEDRFNAFFKCGMVAYKERIKICAAFVTIEAWVKNFKTNQRRSSRPISEYKDKREVLTVFGETIEKK